MEIQRQQRMTQKKSKELREISLTENSNEVKLDYSVPITEINFDDNRSRLGIKSTEQKQASEHDLLLYQQRIRKAESTLTPEEIKTLVYENNQRRTALEESIRQQKQEYMQRHNLELQARRAKRREEERAHRIANENDTQRQMRIAAEERLRLVVLSNFNCWRINVNEN
jgi:hypothetical protein